MKLVTVSCCNLQQVQRQSVWAQIQAERPDVLLLLGDTVYLSNHHHHSAAALASELRTLFDQQHAEPHFAALLADLHTRGAALLAIYDDHDFLGENRCGADVAFNWADAARSEFARAWAQPLRAGVMYRRQTVGTVDIVLLDTRFHRHAPANPAACNDPDAVLGAPQWAWLEAELRACTRPYLALASSITAHRWADECWEQYPAAFARLRRLIGCRPGCVFLSGDVHRNAAFDDSGILEIVSSGVARQSLAFGTLHSNYGVLTFGPQALQVDLRSLKAGSRFKFEVPLARWSLG
jgi:phosphodiesterase/alkaline phosphatase D-like protein